MNNKQTAISHIQAFTGKTYYLWDAALTITEAEYDNDEANYYFFISFKAEQKSPTGDHYVIDLFFVDCQTHGYHFDFYDFRVIDDNNETVLAVLDDVEILPHELPPEIQNVVGQMIMGHVVAEHIGRIKMAMQPSYGLPIQ